jgi:hypothetical protein
MARHVYEDCLHVETISCVSWVLWYLLCFDELWPGGLRHTPAMCWLIPSSEAEAGAEAA